MLFQMRYVMAEDSLPRSVEELLSQAHATLVTEISMRDIAEVEVPSVEALIDTLDMSLIEAGGPLAGLFRGYTPRELPVVEAAEIIDTPENRYVKYFLEECRCSLNGLPPIWALRAKSRRRAKRKAGCRSCRNCSRTIFGAASA